MRLTAMPAGAGTACTSATHPRHGDGEVPPLLSDSYAESEYLLHGLARTYTGPVTGPVRVAGGPRPYRSRMLVRLPRDPAAFSGRVLIEPFNTTYGLDLDALWSRIGSALQSIGDGWVGVTTRAASAVALKDFDAERYRELDIGTDDFAWDLLADLAGAIKRDDGKAGPIGRPVRNVYLGGYSQSALDTATFATAFHNAARSSGGAPIFDGYFPASHAASLTAIASADRAIPTRETAPVGPVDVPLIEVQSQSDVEGFTDAIGSTTITVAGSASVRRDDSDTADDRYRLYEVAGSAHVARLDCCDGRGSSFPTAAFLRAAYRNLTRWAEERIAPPSAPRLTLAVAGPVSRTAVDHDGNPCGGVRSPFVDMALLRYAAHSSPGPLCRLVGEETPLPASILRGRYGDAGGYLREFARALDETIRAGYLLAEDRCALLNLAESQARHVFTDTRMREVTP